MATSGQQIFDLGSRDVQAAAPEPEAANERGGVFSRLRESLSKSRQALVEEISASLFDRIDEETWERLHEALILADTGAPTTAEVVERLARAGGARAGSAPAPGGPRTTAAALPPGAPPRPGPARP